MASLRFMTLADEVLRDLAKRHTELSDPERRLEVTKAVNSAYVVGRSEADNREAIVAAVEAMMDKDGGNASSESTSENIGEIYVFNVLWFAKGAVFATETHHISYANKHDGRDIEEFLVLESDKNFSMAEGATWSCIANNVPFEVLDDETTVKFLGRRGGMICEMGRFIVADMKRQLDLEHGDPDQPIRP